MVINTKEHSDKRPAKQGAGEVIREPNKIGACTPYDFESKNLTAYGGLLPGSDYAGETRIPAIDRRDADGEAGHAGHVPVSVRAGHGVGGVRRLFPAASPALSGTGADVDGHPEGVASAAAMYLLAVSGSAASGRGAATAGSAAADAGTSVGSGPRPTGGGDAGHRHDRAHLVRPADGRAQELQPPEQGQEERPTDPDVYGGDAGGPQRRGAQRRSTHGRAERPASGKCVRGPAAAGTDHLCSRRLGLLLCGRGERL